MTADAAASLTRRSPFGATSPEPFAVARGDGIEIRERPFLAQLLVRMPPTRDALAAVDTGLEVTLPTTPNRLVAARVAGRLAIWLGPDEWLLVDRGEPAAMEAQVAAVVGPHAGTVVDVSAQRSLLELEGPRVPDLLAAGSSVDFDPSVFDVGSVAQTVLARVDVIVGRGGPQTWHVAVRASFARYLLDWLTDAIAGLG